MGDMDVSLFDYDLPHGLIAQYPVERREDSRMLVLPRFEGDPQHRRFRDFPGYLRAGDCVVINDTRVIPARLVGRRPTGGKVELLLLRALDGRVWEALARPARRFNIGTTFTFGDPVPGDGAAIVATVRDRLGEGRVAVELESQGDLMAALDRVGAVPLPPYIRGGVAEPGDKERYQTVYATAPGAVAAPTAGLHFDAATFQALADKGVQVATVTLHVGLGTFRPVEASRVEDHVMHEEAYDVPQASADMICDTRERGGRVVAIGTTTVRVLETAADQTGKVAAGAGWSDIFITPGYRYKVTGALLTNFHLPKSTLIMMVSAFAGRERVLAAYQEAVRSGYRFYSYGDCMLIIA
jgi:S-adenosylmethionine:tRNA ribosyltransferase-isomerase